MSEQIESYLKALEDAAAAGVRYTEKTDLLDGTTPADWQDNLLDLLRDEVKAGRMTEDENTEVQLTRLPY